MSEEDDEGDISSVLIDSTSTSYGDMMMLERVLSLHGGESGEGARNFRVAYERLQKVYEKRLVSLERALEKCVQATKADPVVKQMKVDDASSKFASDRVIEMFRNVLDGESERQIRALANQIAARDSALVASERKQNRLLEKIHSMSMELRESRSRVQTLLVSQSRVVEEENEKETSRIRFDTPLDTSHSFEKQLTRSARKATKRLREQLEMSQQHLRESEIERLALRDKYIAMGEKMEVAFRAQISDLSAEKKDVNLRLKRCENELSKSRRRCEQLEEERDRIETLSERLRKDLLGMQARAQEESTSFRDETSSFVREKSKLIEQMTLLRSKSEVLRRDNADLDSKFRSVSERCEELRVQWETERSRRESAERSLRDTKEDLNSRLNQYELANLKLTEEHKIALRDAVNAEKRLASQHLEATLSKERADHRRVIESLESDLERKFSSEISQRVGMETNRKVEISVSKERAAHLQAMENLESRLREEFAKELLLKVRTESTKWKTRYEEERLRFSNCEKELSQAREQIESLNMNLNEERRETTIKIEKIHEDYQSQMHTKTIAFERKMIEAAEQSRNSVEADKRIRQSMEKEFEEKRTFVRFCRITLKEKSHKLEQKQVLAEIERLSFATSRSDNLLSTCQNKDYSARSCKDVLDFVRSCFEKFEIEMNELRGKLEICQDQLKTVEQEEEETRSLAVELETKALRRSLRTAEAELASLRELSNHPSDASVEVKRRMKELIRAVEVRDRELRDMRALMIEANKALKQGRKELRRSKRRERRALNRMTNELIVDTTTTNVSSMVKSHEDRNNNEDDVPLRASDLMTSDNIESEIRKLRDMKSKLSSSTSHVYKTRRENTQFNRENTQLSRSQPMTTSSITQEDVAPLLEDPLRHDSFSSSELGPAEPSTRRQSDETFEMTVYYTSTAGKVGGGGISSRPPPGLDDVGISSRPPPGLDDV